MCTFLPVCTVIFYVYTYKCYYALWSVECGGVYDVVGSGYTT